MTAAAAVTEARLQVLEVVNFSQVSQIMAQQLHMEETTSASEEFQRKRERRIWRPWQYVFFKLPLTVRTPYE